MNENDKFNEPIVTPTTKADKEIMTKILVQVKFYQATYWIKTPINFTFISRAF